MDPRARSRSRTSTRTAVPSPAAFSFDDPVPSDSDTVVMTDTVVAPPKPHSLERQVQIKLLAQPDLKFSSLVVRRTIDGVCLEGILESGDPDVCSLAQQVAGVNRVINHLLVRRPE